MASASCTLFNSVSHFLSLLLITKLIQHSESCPEEYPFNFNFNCPDNVYNGPLSSFLFTNTSLRDYKCLSGPCELTCGLTNHTMINCSDDDEEPPHRVLEINPSPNDLTITVAVDHPEGWLASDSDYLKQFPCKVYLQLNSSFPLFKSVSLSITGSPGENQTFLGCPFPEKHNFWDGHYYSVSINGDEQKNVIVYGPYEYGRFPSKKPLPPSCMKFQTYYSTQEVPASPPSPPNVNSKRGVLAPALMIVISAIWILVGLVIGLIIGRCYSLRIKKSSANVEAFLRTYKSFSPQRYTYLDIKKMTSSFKEKVGQGGFGTVYKGRLDNGLLVAVKLLKQSKGDNGKEFINEVATIGRTNHVNIVALLGFCFQRSKRALVYEFMPNGSLDNFTKAQDHIHFDVSKSLAWRTMYEISLGIARGLEYLHRGCHARILHFDIKPHNILLDENFCPKISDFGLAKLYPHDKQSKVTMSEARGTVGYIAPEVFNRGFGHVSHKSDVYSYGMMVLEVIGSRRRDNDGAQSSSSDMYFPNWIYKQMDRDEDNEEEIGGAISDEEKEVKRKLILVSLWCIQTAPSSRPSMSRVVQMLEGQLDTNVIPPMPTLSSSPRLNPYLSASNSESFIVTL